MNVNEYKDSSECTVTITNEPTSLQLPPFIRVVLDCERVNTDLFDIVLNSPPPTENMAWVVIEGLRTTLPKVTVCPLFGNVVRIYSPRWSLSTDFPVLGAFLYDNRFFPTEKDKTLFYKHLRFGHYDEALNEILKEGNLSYYYKYGELHGAVRSRRQTP